VRGTSNSSAPAISAVASGTTCESAAPRPSAGCVDEDQHAGSR
jgi:hypothetical protein